MPPALRWRRKMSTPFFPGAWPNTSSSDQDDDQRLPVYSDDAPPQLPELRDLSSRSRCVEGKEDPTRLVEEGWGFQISSTLEMHGSEDDALVGCAREQTNSQPLLVSSPASINMPLSASISQHSTFTEATDSEGILTPQSLQDPLWISPHTESSQDTKDTVVSRQGSFYRSFHDQTRHSDDSFMHDTTIDMIDANTTISSSNAADFLPPLISRRPTYIGAPILDFAEPLPLTRISLDWDAVTSSPGTNTNSLPSPCSQLLSMETSYTAAYPVQGEGVPALLSSEAMATTFFPVPASSSHGHVSDIHQEIRHLVSPSLSSPSAHSVGTDSPVLPADVDPIQNPQPPISSPYLLMADDLDAFAAAASGSSLSLPTSLHSAMSDSLTTEGGIKEPVLNPSPRKCLHGEDLGSALVVAGCPGNGTRPPSTPGADTENYDEYDEANNTAVEEAIRMRARRMSAPLLHLPHTPVRRITPRDRRQTVSSCVEVEQIGDMYSAPVARGDGPVRLLGRMRKFGGRLRSFFGGKGSRVPMDAGIEGSNELEVKKTRRTAVTKVEYESERPIPVPETPARDARASRRSLPLQMSKSPSSSPAMLRRDSFLPIDNPEASPKGLLSIPLQHMRGSPSIQFKKDERPASSPRTSKIRLPRSRMQTAPTESLLQAKVYDKAAGPKPARRFSLSSALSKSRMDVLKTAMVPHPPIPDFPRSPTCDAPARNDTPVRPVSMISATGLDAKSSQSSLKQAPVGSKKGKERARPVSMFVGRSAPKRSFWDFPQPQRPVHNSLLQNGEDAPAASTSKNAVRVRARPISMPVGKERCENWDVGDVGGPRINLHQPKPRIYAGGQSSPVVNQVEAPRMAVPLVEDPVCSVLEEMSDEMASPQELSRDKEPPHATQSDNGTTQSSRRFSLSSAISKRAMRARSMVVSVGRRNSDIERADSSGSTDVTVTPVNTSNSRSSHRARGDTFSTIIDAGVRFDMLTPGLGFAGSSLAPSLLPTEQRLRQASVRSDGVDTGCDQARTPMLGQFGFESTGGTVGLEEYPAPESELDSMSFAGTAPSMESITGTNSMDWTSSCDDSFADASSEPALSDTSAFGGEGTRPSIGLGEPFETGSPVTKRVELSCVECPGLGGSSASSDGDTPACESVERDEERGFLRALGLEFDESLNRRMGVERGMLL